MPLPFIADKTFDKKDFQVNNLTRAEYDNCTFLNCNFTDVFLSAFIFTECHFKDCNLSGVKIKDAIFKDVQFSDCKLLGVTFSDCSEFLFSFQANNSTFSFSSFYNKNLKHTIFNNCILEKVDFTNANLSLAEFIQSDLNHAVFEKTNLEKANLISAYNFDINPDTNNLKGAKFSKAGALHLLNSYQIVIE